MLRLRSAVPQHWLLNASYNKVWIFYLSYNCIKERGLKLKIFLCIEAFSQCQAMQMTKTNIWKNQSILIFVQITSSIVDGSIVNYFLEMLLLKFITLIKKFLKLHNTENCGCFRVWKYNFLPHRVQTLWRDVTRTLYKSLIRTKGVVLLGICPVQNQI